jgi:DNA-binding PadR family transcriptional regulator
MKQATASVHLEAEPRSAEKLVKTVSRMPVRAVGPGEWAVLGLLCERPAHGWAVARALDPAGEVGVVWSLGRPLVYRSIELLKAWGLIEPVGYEPGIRGPNRMVYRATDAGIHAIGQWLREPVDHVRDVRSQLLLKLVLAERAGIDSAPMLADQRRTFAKTVDSLERRMSASKGSERTLLRFRVESMRGVLLFLEGLLGERGSRAAGLDPTPDGVRG